MSKYFSKRKNFSVLKKVGGRLVKVSLANGNRTDVTQEYLESYRANVRIIGNKLVKHLKGALSNLKFDSKFLPSTEETLILYQQFANAVSKMGLAGVEATEHLDTYGRLAKIYLEIATHAFDVDKLYENNKSTTEERDKEKSLRTQFAIEIDDRLNKNTASFEWFSLFCERLSILMTEPAARDKWPSLFNSRFDNHKLLLSQGDDWTSHEKFYARCVKAETMYWHKNISPLARCHTDYPSLIMLAYPFELSPKGLVLTTPGIRANRFWPLGLCIKPCMADGAEITPALFLTHDDHHWRLIKSELMQWNVFYLNDKRPEKYATRKHLNNGLILFIKTLNILYDIATKQEKGSDEAIMFMFFAFFVAHENSHPTLTDRISTLFSKYILSVKYKALKDRRYYGSLLPPSFFHRNLFWDRTKKNERLSYIKQFSEAFHKEVAAHQKFEKIKDGFDKFKLEFSEQDIYLCMDAISFPLYTLKNTESLSEIFSDYVKKDKASIFRELSELFLTSNEVYLITWAHKLPTYSFTERKLPFVVGDLRLKVATIKSLPEKDNDKSTTIYPIFLLSKTQFNRFASIVKTLEKNGYLLYNYALTDEDVINKLKNIDKFNRAIMDEKVSEIVNAHGLTIKLPNGKENTHEQRLKILLKDKGWWYNNVQELEKHIQKTEDERWYINLVEQPLNLDIFASAKLCYRGKIMYTYRMSLDYLKNLLDLYQYDLAQFKIELFTLAAESIFNKERDKHFTRTLYYLDFNELQKRKPDLDMVLQPYGLSRVKIKRKDNTGHWQVSIVSAVKFYRYFCELLCNKMKSPVSSGNSHKTNNLNNNLSKQQESTTTSMDPTPGISPK